MGEFGPSGVCGKGVKKDVALVSYHGASESGEKVVSVLIVVVGENLWVALTLVLGFVDHTSYLDFTSDVGPAVFAPRCHRERVQNLS
jgi:hypothetical protein